MTDIRSLIMCLDIGRLAVEAGLIEDGLPTTHLSLIRIVRRTPWGKRVSLSTLSRAFRASNP
jgi:hypothetical protein